DLGGYALWRGLIRDDVLRDLVYTNREFSGAEAERIGLATYVEGDPLAKANKIAEVIANKNPHAIRAAKRLSEGIIERETDAILLEESIEQHAIIRSPNQVEAVMAAMAKRAPEFQDV
ncbi:MAG TPA: enoyl-CoA hydratase, partial [Erythrobacter sp.]|nr:enoyl-CoA hydratase [Erythrobacter sp.]